MRQLRNRVAHHEPIHHLPLEELHEAALDVIGWIDPAAADWARATTRVGDVLSGRPGAVRPLAVVVPASLAWPLYGEQHAYVCQPGRFFQRVSHIAFSTDGAVQPEIAKIVDRRNEVQWSREAIAPLMASGDPRDARLGRLIKASRAMGWEHSDTYQVFLLTAPGEPGHVTLAAPIPHARSGRGSAFVQRQRYADVEALTVASTTADIPAWR